MMGMFDTVYMNRRSYQTKDLECVMDEYEVISNRLFRRQYDFEWVDDDEHFLGGYLNSTFLGLREMNDYTGTIEMYDDKNVLFCVFSQGVMVRAYNNNGGEYNSVNHFLTERFCNMLAQENAKKDSTSFRRIDND